MDSKGKAETLKEQVDAISREPVASAINNLQTEYFEIAKRLRKNSIQVHGSILNMLQTEFQLRQDETRNALEEHKFQESVKQRQAQMEAAEKLQAEQKAIEEANRPRLVPAGEQPEVAAVGSAGKVQ